MSTVGQKIKTALEGLPPAMSITAVALADRIKEPQLVVRDYLRTMATDKDVVRTAAIVYANGEHTFTVYRLNR